MDSDQHDSSDHAAGDSTVEPAPWWRGLAGKLLALTVIFIMIGEVLIFLPSIANFRVTWLKGRIAMAEVAALVVEAAPGKQITDELRLRLLRNAGVKVVAVKTGQVRQLMLRSDEDVQVAASFDLRKPLWFDAVWQALYVLARGGDRVIDVVDAAPNMPEELIELALDETPLRQAMITYSFNILKLSIVLSLIVAGLVFLALHYLMIRPMRRLSQQMIDFAANPEDASRIIAPSGRRDEIGFAEVQLGNMQGELSRMLQQKSRLASLGLAVSKISHDLRNMLASAQLISDRLSMVDDPTVKKFAPKLISSLDRAIDFCAQTLKFGRADEAPPKREKLALKPLAEEVVDTALMQASSRIVLYNDIHDAIVVDADREHLFRVLMNMVNNAVAALEQAPPAGQEGRVRLRAWREGATTTIEVADNGPGVPEKARAHLFEAFKGSARAGGTGLGLSIANELVSAHGGEIRLINQAGVTGAVFWVIIPDRVVELRPGRRGRKESA